MSFLLTSLHIFTFFKILSTVFASTIGAGFGETRAVFVQPLFKDWAIYPVALLFCYTVAFIRFFTPVTVIIFFRLTRVRIAKYFLQIILHTVAFLFLPLDDWRTAENLSSETSPYP